MNLTTATLYEHPPSNTHTSPSPHAVAPHRATDHERFPSLDETKGNGYIHQMASPVEITPSQAIPDRYKWPARKSSQRGRDSGRPPGLPGHRPRRSVSEALRNLRTRRASVSESAQELAEALKAPVSYRLIVRLHTAIPFMIAI